MHSSPCHRAARAALIGAALAAACGDPFGLPRAVFEVQAETDTLYALDGTALTLPSAFNLGDAQPIRTDRSTVFDFAFNIDTLDQALLLPTGALGLPRGSGIRVMTVPIDSIKIAPTRGYTDTAAVKVDRGSVVVIRSRPFTCSFGTTAFLYAKLRVLAVHPGERRLAFEIHVNRNCGYRSLEPGLPRR
ncbi:MAG: hypothetical protein ACREL9_12095 [Gemmatimonadales bacterium]